MRRGVSSQTWGQPLQDQVLPSPQPLRGLCLAFHLEETSKGERQPFSECIKALSVRWKGR